MRPEGEDLAGVLRRTGAYLTAAGGDEPATAIHAIHAIYDPARRTFTRSAAGHPPPLVRRADGSVTVFDDKRFAGPLLGLSAGERRDSATVTLTPGTTVVFSTDGLVERRGEFRRNTTLGGLTGPRCGVGSQATRAP